MRIAISDFVEDIILLVIAITQKSQNQERNNVPEGKSHFSFHFFLLAFPDYREVFE